MSIRSFLFGRRADWHLRTPSVPRLRPGRTWLGPLSIALSSVIGWFAFADAQGDGNVAFGLWVGAVSIMLMAWSFVLALRPRVLEPLFGGLDSMYRSHRWAGALSVLFMWLHTSAEPEIEGGVPGAARSVARAAEDLAETGQTMIYALIGLSVLRLVPYRWWRLTHKLFGVPFAFACWHFFTAEKPYANGSPWGWWFGAWMLLGLGAFVWRVVGRDMIRRGHRYEVVAAVHEHDTTRLELAPIGRPLRHRLGQFAFVKLDVPGMREPHPFTIASAPGRANLEFVIRHLGDWSNRLPDHDLVGRRARIEGPYGEFAPFGVEGHPTVWIAGGVGATPFLAALDALDAEPQPGHVRSIPTMMYATRDPGGTIVEQLRAAERAGHLDLVLFTPATGRMGPADLDAHFPQGLDDHHVALCGPAGLVAEMADAAHRRGAAHVETEDFDIRQGFGPDRSAEIDRLVRERRKWANAISDVRRTQAEIEP